MDNVGSRFRTILSLLACAMLLMLALPVGANPPAPDGQELLSRPTPLLAEPGWVAANSNLAQPSFPHYRLTREGQWLPEEALAYASDVYLPLVRRPPTPTRAPSTPTQTPTRTSTPTATARPSQELSFDDGTCEGYPKVRAAAVRFSVNERRQIKELRYHLKGQSDPVELLVYDASWSVLYRAPETPGPLDEDEYRWWGHDVGAVVMVGPGDFYVGVVWPSTGANPHLGADSDQPHTSRSYGSREGPDPPFRLLDDYGSLWAVDLMIRAVVYQPTSTPTPTSTPIRTATPTSPSFTELYYDDGTYDGYHFLTAGAVRFTVGERRQVMQLRYFLRGGSGTVQLSVYDANWSVLYSASVTPGPLSAGELRWWNHDLGTGVTVGPGDFYVAMVWPSGGHSDPRLGEDTSPPHAGRSYGSWEDLNPPFGLLPGPYYMDLMIRVWVQ